MEGSSFILLFISFFSYNLQIYLCLLVLSIITVTLVVCLHRAEYYYRNFVIALVLNHNYPSASTMAIGKGLNKAD